MKKLRTAVIGLGRIGWQCHLPNAAKHQGFEPIAVVDPLKERLDEAHEEYGVTGYRDCQSMYEAEDLDLVVIASPTHFHAEQTIQAIEHGVNVFCDKPMARTLDEADAMIKAAKQHDRKLMMYQPHRGYPADVALADVMTRDLIGPVFMIKCACSHYTRRNDWQAFKKNGGGMLFNYGAHYVDKLLHLTGDAVTSISCAMRTVASLGDAPDVVKILMETTGGIILDIDINMATACTIPPYCVMGKYGTISLNDDHSAWDVRYFDPSKLQTLELQGKDAAENRLYDTGEVIPWEDKVFPLADYEGIDYYQKVYEYFALDQEPFVPLEESREVMRVLTECQRLQE